MFLKFQNTTDKIKHLCLCGGSLFKSGGSLKIIYNNPWEWEREVWAFNRGWIFLAYIASQKQIIDIILIDWKKIIASFLATEK